MLSKLIRENMKKYIFLALFLICGCSPVNVEPAKLEVNIFHDLYQEKNTVTYIKLHQSIFRQQHLKKNSSI